MWQWQKEGQQAGRLAAHRQQRQGATVARTHPPASQQPLCCPLRARFAPASKTVPAPPSKQPPLPPPPPIHQPTHPPGSRSACVCPQKRGSRSARGVCGSSPAGTAPGCPAPRKSPPQPASQPAGRQVGWAGRLMRWGGAGQPAGLRQGSQRGSGRSGQGPGPDQAE